MTRDIAGQVFKATFNRADLQATIAGLEMILRGGVTETVIARIAGEALMQLKTAEMEE
jgi:ribonuclease HI